MPRSNMSRVKIDNEAEEMSSTAEVAGAAGLNVLPCVDHVAANALLELYHEQPVSLNLPPTTVEALRSLVALRQSVGIGGELSAGTYTVGDQVRSNGYTQIVPKENTASTRSFREKMQGGSLAVYQDQLIEYLTKNARHRKEEAIRIARMACKRIELNFMSSFALKMSSEFSDIQQRDQSKMQEQESMKKVRGPYRCSGCGKATGGEKKTSRSSSHDENSCRCLPEMIRVPSTIWTQQIQHPTTSNAFVFDREALRPYLVTVVSDIVTLRAEYAKTKRFADVKNKKKQLRKGDFFPKTDNSSKYKCHRCKLPIGCSQHSRLNICRCLGLCRCHTITVRVPFEIWANENLSKSSLEENLLSLFAEKLSDEIRCGMKGRKRQISLLVEENIERKRDLKADLKNDDSIISI